MAALTLANATAETAFQLANQTASKGIIRIEEATQKGIEELFKKKEDPKLKDKPAELAKELAKTAFHHKNKIEHVMYREQQAIKSVERLGENQELNTLIHTVCEDIANRVQQKTARLEEALSFIAKTLAITIPAKLEETEADAELKRLIPKRLFKGTLNFDLLKKVLGEKEYEWYQEIDEKDRAFDNKAAEFVNFMDGKRTAHHILKAVSAEYTPTNPEHVLKFLRDLEKANLITFQ
jgi:vacuolar-type H+-ATPase subunit I/STV1